MSSGSGILPGPPAERAHSLTPKISTPSRSNSLNRPSSRATGRGSAAPGGTALAEGLQTASMVSPGSCSGRDRLWLPSAAASNQGVFGQQAGGPTAVLPSAPTSAPAAKAVNSVPAPAPAPAHWEGTSSVQTIRPPTAPLQEKGKVANSPAPSPHAASAPSAVGSGRPASAGRQPSRESGNRRRPASAGGRLAAGEGASKVAEPPPAGMRAGKPPWSPHGRQHRIVQARGQARGAGWSPKALEPEEHLRHDPILHRIDVYMRGESGDVMKFGTHKGQYSEALRQAALRRHAGRRKGVSEFDDLCALGAPNWDPGHHAALEQDRHVFHRQRGNCAEMYELAAKYPCKPKPFEPNRFMKCGGSDAPSPRRPAVPPPRRAEARTASARTRRPPSAGRRSAPAGAVTTPTLVAPSLSEK